MFLYVWRLGGNDVKFSELNAALIKNGLPASAHQITVKKAFRKAYRYYSSVRDLDWQVNTITRDKGTELIAVVKRDRSNIKKLKLNHECTLALSNIKGVPSVMYICPCRMESSFHNLKDKCPHCGADIPDIVISIHEKYKYHVARMDNEERSTFYSQYIKKVTDSFSLSGNGRPYMVHSDKKHILDKIKDAMSQIGDELIIIEIVDDDGAAKAVRVSFEERINALAREVEDWDASTGEKLKSNRLIKAKEMLDNIGAYSSILKDMKSGLEEKGQKIRDKISKMISG